jgi:hypothetical protein
VALPEIIAQSLRESGFRPLKGDVWKQGQNRWSVSCAEAPQSWERMLSPLLAQAILEARAGAEASSARPLAVLFAPRISDAMHDRLAEFAGRVAPGQAWIASDARGRSFFHVPGNEAGLRQQLPVLSPPLLSRRRVSLFTDLHQWMLKVLLADHFDEKLIHAPRGRSVRNARVLAEVAKVSVPAAARFVKALDKAGHLERSFGDLRIAESLRLLDSWRAAVPVSYREEVGARYVRGFEPDAFRHVIQIAQKMHHGRSFRMAFGLFMACENLGFGHVRGGPRHLYVERLDQRMLEDIGLVLVREGEQPDVFLRVPRFPESLFRAAPGDNSDIIQCWLDVSHHPARGQEQADFLWRRAIAPALEQ